MFKIHKDLLELTDVLMQVVSRTVHASNLARHVLDLLVELLSAFIFSLQFVFKHLLLLLKILLELFLSVV